MLCNHCNRFILVAGLLGLLWACSSFETRHPAGCRTIQGVPGPEDFDIDLKHDGRLIISSQERRQFNPGGEMLEPGRIFYMKATGGAAQAFTIAGRDDYPFHPHGISVVRTGSASILYVINHALRDQHSIEKFKIEKERLWFLARYESPLLTHPNDLVATARGDVYITNDRTYTGIPGDLGDLFSLGLSNVVHLNTRSDRFQEAASGIAFANGIAVSSNRLYVAGTRDEGITVFERSASTGLVGRELDFIHVGSGVDNLLWEKPGLLNVAAHPEIFDFLDHVDDSEAHAASEVYRVDVYSGQVRRIFGDPGPLIDAASSALVFRGRLIMAQVFDPEIVICSAP